MITPFTFEKGIPWSEVYRSRWNKQDDMQLMTASHPSMKLLKVHLGLQQGSKVHLGLQQGSKIHLRLQQGSNSFPCNELWIAPIDWPMYIKNVSLSCLYQNLYLLVWKHLQLHRRNPIHVQWYFSKRDNIQTKNFGQFKGVARLQRLIYNSQNHCGISNCDRFTEVGQFSEGQVYRVFSVQPKT